MRVPWVEKYRPVDIRDFALDDYMISLFSRIDRNSLTNIILCGSSGIGKTSLAYFICRSNNLRFREYNASDTRGINTIHEIIKWYKTTTNGTTEKACVILDEADNLTVKAQELIVSCMDTHPNLYFIMTCNCVNDMIQSMFEKSITIKVITSKTAVEHRILDILDKEGVVCDIELIRRVYNYSNSDIRLIINKLEMMSYIPDTKIITADIVDRYSKHPGYSDANDFILAVSSGDQRIVTECYMHKKKNSGVNISDSVVYMIDVLTASVSSPSADIEDEKKTAFLEHLHDHTFKCRSNQLMESEIQFVALLYRVTDLFRRAS